MDFPGSPAELSTEWLGRVLGRPVAGFRVDDIGQGIGVMAQVSRVHLTYADPGAIGAGAPASVVVKTASAAPENREVGTQYAFYRREVSFYQGVAGDLPLTVPRCWYAEMAESSVPFVIVMEDMAGSRVVDQLDGPSPADAELVVDAVARLHARWWDSPELDELDWLLPMNNDLYKGYAAVLPQLVPVLRAKYGDRLDPAGFELLDALGPLYTAYLDHWMASGPTTFIHFDLRGDNIFYDPPSAPGSVCLLDWQFAVRHRGVFDVAYYLGQCVPTPFRRTHEEALLRRYHDAITGLGVSGYGFDQCFDDYRRSMIMHPVMATQTAVLDAGNERGQRLVESMMERGWASALDLDAVSFLPELRAFAGR